MRGGSVSLETALRSSAYSEHGLVPAVGQGGMTVSYSQGGYSTTAPRGGVRKEPNTAAGGGGRGAQRGGLPFYRVPGAERQTSFTS